MYTSHCFLPKTPMKFPDSDVGKILEKLNSDGMLERMNALDFAKVTNAVFEAWVSGVERGMEPSKKMYS